MSSVLSNQNLTIIRIQSPWEEKQLTAPFRDSRCSSASKPGIKKSISMVLLGCFEFLTNLPGGINSKHIHAPARFPFLKENEVLAFHGDRLGNKPLIACFSLEHVHELETAYNRGLFAQRDWVILSFSDTELFRKIRKLSFG